MRYFAERGHEIHLIGVRPAREALPKGMVLYDLTARTNIRKLRYLAWAPSVRRIVREIRSGVVVAPEDVEAISDQIVALYQGWEQGELVVTSDQEVIARYDRRHLTSMLAGALDEILYAEDRL